MYKSYCILNVIFQSLNQQFLRVGIIVVTEKVEEAFLQPEEVIDVAVILEEEICYR